MDAQQEHNSCGCKGCHRVQNLIPLYAGNDLTSPVRREQVRRHVKVCSRCRDELREHRRSLSRIRSLASGDDPLDADAFHRDLERRLSECADLRERMEDEPQESSRRGWPPYLVKGVRSAALLLVGLAVGFGGMVLVPDDSSRDEPPMSTPRSNTREEERIGDRDTRPEADGVSRAPMLRGRLRPASTAAPMTEIQRTDGSRTEYFLRPIDQNSPSENTRKETTEDVTAVGM